MEIIYLRAFNSNLQVETTVKSLSSPLWILNLGSDSFFVMIYSWRLRTTHNLLHLKLNFDPGMEINYLRAFNSDLQVETMVKS